MRISDWLFPRYVIEGQYRRDGEKRWTPVGVLATCPRWQRPTIEWGLGVLVNRLSPRFRGRIDALLVRRERGDTEGS